MSTHPDKIHLHAIIPAEFANRRIDQVLSQLFPEHSRARITHWIRQQYVMVNDHPVKPKDKVHGGETVLINAYMEVQSSAQAQAIALDIVHEDEALIIINKPAGLVVHPGAGNADNTLLNALLHHCPTLANIPRAGIIHRLDKDTSGLLAIAKTLSAHTYLVAALQRREIQRQYAAIVNGAIIAGGEIVAPIGRHPKNRLKMAVVERGKDATTQYRVLEKFKAHTYLQVNLVSGRTHQIRVHMAHLQHPLIGDPLYGGRLKLPKASGEKLQHCLQQFKRQALHAEKLSLIHPGTGRESSWKQPLPADMQQLLAVLRSDSSI